MGTEELNYWYDAQLRRISIQVTRIFANLHYATGYQRDGSFVLRKIPARYASTNRQVAHILRNNSENVMMSIPMITVYMSNVEYGRERLQEPFHVDKQQIYERNWDEDTGEYSTELGASYTLERVMAVPYNLTFQVDIWTSNIEQKHQIAEQIMILFNPGLQLQNSDNAFDWTALGEIMLNSINWSSRGLPIGTSDEIEITTLEFRLETWISPPAILNKQKVIHTIITNILQNDEFIAQSVKKGREIEWSESDLLGRVIITPGNHAIMIEGNIITLLGESNNDLNADGETFQWEPLIEQYGPFRPGISAIRINPTNDIEDFDQSIIGTLELGPERNQLIWVVDPMTLPMNTLPAIKAIIDPHKAWPTRGLAVPATGDRYLLLQDIGDSVAWGNISAKANDIIEYDGTKWNVVFLAENEKGRIYYLLNTFTNKQLKWNSEEWTFALDGIYTRGFWRLLL